jgi:phage-related tail fiber protein
MTMPTFDPQTGKLIDPDALRSIQVNARGPIKPKVRVDRAADVKHVEILNTDTGGHVGHHTHHADGRMAATVNAQPAVADFSQPGDTP